LRITAGECKGYVPTVWANQLIVADLPFSVFWQVQTKKEELKWNTKIGRALFPAHGKMK
jgi:hypothetical protein